MKISSKYLFLICLLWSLNAFGMTRTIKSEPAVVLTAFGTTTKARATFDFINQQVTSEDFMKKVHTEWAFTSEIVRERANKAFEKKGEATRYLSLPQVLANLEAEGYRKVVVQPLHIFPGQEFDEVMLAIQAFEILGMRIELGDTLLHKWPYIHEVIKILEKDFLPVAEGCNVIITHGSPKAFHSVNSAYLGIDRYVSGLYPNVFVGTVEGILPREQTLIKAGNCPQKMIRFIPLMLVSGGHIMNDIMADKPDGDDISWSLEMKQKGFKTDTLTVQYKGEQLYKGLGFNKDIVAIYIRSIQHALKQLDKL